MMPSSMSVTDGISVVIPMLDEQDNVAPLLDELHSTMNEHFEKYELIIVDDGSSDSTYAQLQSSQDSLPDLPLRVLRHRHSFGQTAALATGLSVVQGHVVVTLDGDLQNDPADIPALVERLVESADVVCGWRRHRQEGPIRSIPSRLAAWVIGRLTGLDIHDVGCTLRAYRREIVADLDLWGEMHRFIPALCLAVGARVAEMEVRHRPRTQGATKYGRTGLRRLFRVIPDLVTLSVVSRYRGRPIQVYGWWGIGALVAAVLTAATAGFAGAETGIAVGLCLCLLYAGVVLIGIGAGAELSARAYAAATGARPGYVREEYRSAAWSRLWEPQPGEQTGRAGGTAGPEAS